MKRFLTISILVNVALLGVLLWLRTGERAGSGTKEPAVTAAGPARVGAPASGLWESLPDDTAEAARRLKAAGVPPAVGRAVLAARLESRRDARRQELEAAVPAQPYWREIMPESWVQARMNGRIELRTMEIADETKLTSLFGPGPTPLDKVGDAYYGRFRFGDLPVEKLQALQAIEEDFQEQMRGQGLVSGGLVGPRDEEVVRLLRTERDKDLQALLSPEERETYDLRGSPTADGLRLNMGEFHPSEQEFLAVYRLQRAFDTRYPRDVWRTRQDAAYPAAEEALEVQIAEALGPGRAEDYRRETNYSFQELVRLTAPMGFPRENVQKAWETTKDMQAKFNVLTSNNQVTADPAKLEALQKEGFARIAAVLGPKGEELFHRWINSGDWARAGAR